MTDRELLEAAARAAGHPIDAGHFAAAERPGAWWGWVYIDGSGDPPPEDSAWTELWNPLTDDGDAFRLAVKLEIAVNPFAGKTVVAHTDSGRMGHEKWDCWDDDPYAATRRAIVRAAAALGDDA
jgi:hypothetical protein